MRKVGTPKFYSYRFRKVSASELQDESIAKVESIILPVPASCHRTTKILEKGGGDEAVHNIQRPGPLDTYTTFAADTARGDAAKRWAIWKAHQAPNT